MAEGIEEKDHPDDPCKAEGICANPQSGNKEEESRRILQCVHTLEQRPCMWVGKVLIMFSRAQDWYSSFKIYTSLSGWLWKQDLPIASSIDGPVRFEVASHFEMSRVNHVCLCRGLLQTTKPHRPVSATLRPPCLQDKQGLQFQAKIKLAWCKLKKKQRKTCWGPEF